MPKPYIFAVCEKVIIDLQNVASLIGLFNKITVATKVEVSKIPPEAVFPKEYVFFTSWELGVDDKGKEYLQFYEVHYPDGKQFGERVSTPVKMGDGMRANCLANSQALPLGQSGFYTVCTWLEDRDGKIVHDRISLKFEIERVEQVKPQ